MDKEVFAKLLEVLTEDDGEKAKLIPFETEEDAIKHAEWAAKLKPGDKVNILGHGVAVVSPESMRGNRIILFCPRKKDDGTYNIGCSLCPISAIVPWINLSNGSRMAGAANESSNFRAVRKPGGTGALDVTRQAWGRRMNTPALFS